MTSDHSVGFRSLHNETRLDFLPVDGEVPQWLSGRLYRTGPARFEVEAESYRHWFDGLAMLHAFGIEDGQVSYANRFLHSKSYEQAREHGQIYRSEFATDPCWSIFGRVMSIFSPRLTDNANVNIARLGERYISMTETPLPVEFDPETLETLGHVDMSGPVDADVTTAHPHFDLESGRGLNYLLKYGRKSSYSVVATDVETLEQHKIAELEVDRPAYMHSFAMTERYVVLSEWPLVVNPLEMLARGKPFIENYKWKPERGTRFRVLRKSDGKLVGDLRAPARFGFHHVNAFEDEDANGAELVLDVLTYADPSIIEALYLERVRAEAPVQAAGRLERYRMRPGESAARVEQLSETRLELPRINYEQSSTKPYGCVWGVGAHEPGNFLDQIVRIDVPSGEARTWHEEGCYPGEPVFVARPGARSDDSREDEGVLLSVVLDADAERSFLVVLDAHTLEEQARATVPHHIPFGFHGAFFRDRTQVKDLD